MSETIEVQRAKHEFRTFVDGLTNAAYNSRLYDRDPPPISPWQKSVFRTSDQAARTTSG